MKKMYIAVLAALICAPVFAQEGAQEMQEPPAFEAQEMHKECPMHKKMSEFKMAREEHQAQMKATEEKMEKMVKEYNKLKKGKKKEAKLAEIQAEVAVIHDKQLEFKREQLARFEKRLETMREAFDKENSAEAKTAWVDEHTTKVIEKNGDIKVLFKPEFGGQKHMGKMGPLGHKYPRKDCGCKGKDHKNCGCKDKDKKECGCKGHGPKDGRGPVAELPVEKPQKR